MTRFQMAIEWDLHRETFRIETLDVENRVEKTRN